MSSSAPLLEVDASNISAIYYIPSGILELKAKGEEPAFRLTPFFQREPLLGGLLYSIRAYAGGVGPVEKSPPPPVPFDINTTLYITLPEVNFNNKSVAVETLKGTWTIPIGYVGLVSSPDDKPTTLPATETDPGFNINAGQNTSDVLPPIHENLLDGAQLKITAIVPSTTGPAKAFVNVHYNPIFFKLVDSAHESGTITWTFEWAKLPLDPGQNPQLIDVTTITFNGLLGASSVTSKIIQGYIVSFVVLSK